MEKENTAKKNKWKTELECNGWIRNGRVSAQALNERQKLKERERECNGNDIIHPSQVKVIKSHKNFRQKIKVLKCH
jgi:hypothetical protein